MIYPEYDVLEKWGSKYALVSLAAKRAKQIRSGAPILVDTQSKNALTIALEEIAAGKIKCVVKEDDLPQPTPSEPVLADLLPIPIGDDLDADLAADETADLEDHTEGVLAADEELHDHLIEDEDEEHDDAWHEVVDEESGEIVAVEPSIAVHSDEDELSDEDHEDVTVAPKKRRGRQAVEQDVEPDIIEPIADIDAEEIDSIIEDE